MVKIWPRRAGGDQRWRVAKVAANDGPSASAGQRDQDQGDRERRGQRPGEDDQPEQAESGQHDPLGRPGGGGPGRGQGPGDRPRLQGRPQEAGAGPTGPEPLGPERQGQGEQAGAAHPDGGGDRHPAQHRGPGQVPQSLADGRGQRARLAAGRGRDPGQAGDGRQGQDGQGRLGQHGGGRAGAGRERPGDRRAGDGGGVEAGRLQRVGPGQQRLGDQQGDHAGVAAGGQRPGQPGQGGQRQQGPAGGATGGGQQPEQAGRQQHLVAGQGEPPPAGPVQPGAQHRPGHDRGQGDGRDHRPGQPRPPGAVQHQQHRRHREHLAGQPGQRGREQERRVAGLPGKRRRAGGGGDHPPRVSPRRGRDRSATEGSAGAPAQVWRAVRAGRGSLNR